MVEARIAGPVMEAAVRRCPGSDRAVSTRDHMAYCTGCLRSWFAASQSVFIVPEHRHEVAPRSR